MKVGFAGLLGLLFIGLKLGGIINWSWWLVTLPLWAGLAFAMVLVAATIPVLLVGGLLSAKLTPRWSR